MKFIIILDVFGGSVGIALTQVLSLLGRFQWGVRQSTALENQMVAVERMLEYTNLPLEDTLQSTTSKI